MSTEEAVKVEGGHVSVTTISMSGAETNNGKFLQHTGLTKLIKSITKVMYIFISKLRFSYRSHLSNIQKVYLNIDRSTAVRSVNISIHPMQRVH